MKMGRRSTVLALAVVFQASGASAQDAHFLRGDVNADSCVDIGDAICIVYYAFNVAKDSCRGSVERCTDASDANDDGRIDSADAVTLLAYLFAQVGPLPDPSIKCGFDPTADALDCASFSPCTDSGLTVMLPGNVPLEMVWCPAGTFMMGRYPGEQNSNEWEDFQHQVTLTRAFCLGRYEVTKRQWQAVMQTTPWAGEPYMLDHPDSAAVYVSWDDAQAFIAVVNTLGQGTFSLPTEAQWEYACRAGTTTRFYWGDDPSYTQIGNYAWYMTNAYDAGEQYAHVVGAKLSNAWGLYDMSGNVREWCQDWWEDQYSSGVVTDPTGPSSGFRRVCRGGVWDIYARECRSASRYRFGPSQRLNGYGFRLARTSP